ncbi:hypothetical protein EV1_002688 [Malus domestica]|uniref:uncharacterized protein isoform X1 n=1 Tax=Malus domestica TaxID=3750 RepID=UPI0010AA108A|nr:uncharacterized protein LOC103422093 isoform X1 [Malus domestica]XP_028965307.1 uncharacterized protein LOC103422093 isoform X1 [Malus domestica]XP_028965308.1 uncharacterized protein LOC103422093 isoform X1 [Malus domestica]XP_028965309.1 uncharacterized protein LOC103422093 isoform X1 [Malus domestica]
MAAIATVPPPQPPQQANVPLDSLTHIDISTLSQSELQVLSLFSSSSSSAFNPCRTHDLVVPKIDRSVFNESAGSRRQTYSRPRRQQSDTSTAAAAKGHRRRVAGLLATPPKLTLVPPDDPERNENHAIIAHLKNFISQDPKFDQIDFEPNHTASFSRELIPNDDMRTGIVGFEGRGEMGVKKRKRGRKPKVKVLGLENEGYAGMGMVNTEGAAVDISGLGNAEEPFGEELRRRTVGLETEEELLGFMRDLGGQWGSRRKKRKIVDASEFGDALPVGWKLLLGLKRKEGRAWIYCRRYISPTGEQFLTCKEVSSFLHSFTDHNNAQQLDSGHARENVPEECIVATENQHADKHGDRRQDVNSSSALVVSSMSNEREKEVTLLGVDNLAEVQIHDLFECHKCNLTFNEKDSYLQHLLSFHQRTTRKYRLGSTVGDGVIIKDGKYECQFCHKVFLERRRYNGHVGIHVRNYVRRVEESPGPTTLQKRIESPNSEGLPSRTSKMDALIEIAQNSIMETSTAGPNDQSKGDAALDKPYMGCSSEIHASDSHQEMNIDSPLSEQDLDGRLFDRIDSDQHDSEHTITDGSMEGADDPMEVEDINDSCMNTNELSATEKNGKPSECSLDKDGLASTSDELKKSGTNQDGATRCKIDASSNDEFICDAVGNEILNCTSALEHPNFIDHSTNKNSEQAVDFGSSIEQEPSKSSDTLIESVLQAYEGNELQIGISDSSISVVKSVVCFPTSTAVSDEGDQHLISVAHRHDDTGFEELGLDEIEPLKYGFPSGQESITLQELPMDLTNTAEMEKAFGSSVQFESEEVMLSMAGGRHITTACVWCGVEFNHEGVDSEIQPDSVGFMCPTCKTKISGQLNVLDDDMPVNANPF